MTENPTTGLQKVAQLLKSLPEEIVVKVLKHMDPRQGELLASEVSKVASDPDIPEELPDIRTHAKIDNGLPAATTAAPMTEDAPPAPDGHAPRDDPHEPAAQARDPLLALRVREENSTASPRGDALSALAGISAERLACAFESENGRTALVLLEKLRVNLAAQIYRCLSPAKRKEISLRFAEKNTVDENLIGQIAERVLRKCQTGPGREVRAAPGEERHILMAAMIKGLERGERMEMLGMLGKTDPPLAQRVKNLLYEFEVIAQMENSSIQNLLAEVNMQALALALSGAPAGLEERIMPNLSKRAQDNLRAEISLMGEVKPAKVCEARQCIVQVIQLLDERGEFILRSA